MRKLTGLKVVLLVVGLLTIAGAPPATAQLGNPLSLAASGVLLPYFNDATAGFVSVLEVASPVIPVLNVNIDGPVLNPNNSIHLVYFSQTCVQDGSFPDILTPKQAKAYISSKPDMNWPNQNGLVAIAQSANGIDLDPLDYPLWTRVHWIDAKLGKLRELEPIILDQYRDLIQVPFEAGQIGVSIGQGAPLLWDPLRSAASFVTPQEGSGLAATLLLICPRSSIQGDPTANTGAGIFATGRGFPALVNRDGKKGFPATGNQTGLSVSTLRGRIYDDNENGPFDIAVPCDCLTLAPVKPLSQKYSQAPTVLNLFTVPVWYTELESRNVAPNQLNITGGPQTQYFSFTGYWNLDIAGIPTTLFHRLSNSSLDNIQPGNAGHPNNFFNR